MQQISWLWGFVKGLEPGTWVEMAGVSLGLLTLLLLIQQLLLQNRLARAELIRGQLEMYWRTLAPVTADQVRDFKSFPEDWMHWSNLEVRRRYEGNDTNIMKYLGCTIRCEYLASLHHMQRELAAQGPMSRAWLAHWTDDLMTEVEFRDALEYYQRYYPQFHEYAFRRWTRAGRPEKDGVG